MKKILIAILSVILLLAVPIAGLPLYAAHVPDVYGFTYLAAMADKYDRLHAIQESKIVLIGGSSMAFGVDCEAVERELKMPVVNMGLYAALGSKTTLDLTRAGIGKGDIVIFAPEVDPQAYSLYTNAEITVQTLEADRSMVMRIPLSEWGSLFNELPHYVETKKTLAANGIPSPTNAYARDAFNAYGDNTFARPYNVMPDLYLSTDVIDISIQNLFDPSFIDYVNDYAQKVRKKGATFYFSFPPVNRLALKADSTVESRTAFYNKLATSLRCEIIGNIEDHIMHEGYFYDSNYHLNDSGIPYNTKKLVGDIKRARGDTSKTDITVLPPSGAQSQEIPDDGDDRYAEDFTYVEDTGGWAIESVTDAAKGKSELNIPRYRDGKPVYKIKSGAFNGCSAQTIHIGENITALEDGIFDGCPNLTAVQMSVKLGATDTLPTVGADLFAGANDDLVIFVPPAKYGAMCTDYFWMQYAARLRAAAGS